MKLFSMRTALALACAASLAACGGGTATYPIAGTVYGLKYSPLILASGGQTLTVNAKPLTDGQPTTVTYAFPNPINYGSRYSVTVEKAPAEQDCVAATSDNTSAGQTAAINVAVQCTVHTFPLQVKVVGLTKDGLQLINGSLYGATGVPVPTSTSLDASGNYYVTLPGTVEVYKTYSVVVLNQPNGQTCSIDNGTGVQPNTTVTNITVTCQP